MTVLQHNRRWQLALVLMVTFFVGYLDRYNITFALPLMAVEFGWNEQQTRDYGSLLMGAFFAAYGLANLLLSPLAFRLGARRSLIIMVCLWTLFTAMGAWVSQWLMLLVITRVLLGISEGVHVPMMTQLTKVWFPPQERARANSIFVTGLFLAVIVAPIALVPLMGAIGWRWGFVVVAFSGLLLSLPLVLLMVHDAPRKHPTITTEEVAYVEAGRQLERVEENAEMTWQQLIAMPRFMLLMLIGIVNNMVTLGVSSWLPTYFTNNRGLEFSQITLYVATPYIFSIAGIACWAALGDRLNARSALGAIGFLGASIMLYFALTADELLVVLACFSAGVFMAAAYNACEFAMVQRIVPQEKTAHAVGVYNGVATMIGGGLGPLVVSPMISADGPYWMISAMAALNALLLFWAWRLIRY